MMSVDKKCRFLDLIDVSVSVHYHSHKTPRYSRAMDKGCINKLFKSHNLLAIMTRKEKRKHPRCSNTAYTEDFQCLICVLVPHEATYQFS